MEHVRFRLTWYQRMMPLLPAAIAVTLMTLPLLSPASSRPGLAFPVGVWLALPVVLLSSARFGVTLTPSEAVVHNLRRRTIRWADVQGIWVESSMGVRRVVICEADGRLTRLRAPVTGFLSQDAAFEEKFAAIGEWWLRHRGPEWAPRPQPWRSW
ncbi:hypothetical protein ACFZAU_28295 [Streptomyces sp. NPDC008238]